MTDSIKQELDNREADYKKYLAWRSKMKLLGATIDVVENNPNYIVLNHLDYRGRKLVLPEGIHLVEPGAFNNCDGLEELVLPQSLLNLGTMGSFVDTLSKCNIPPRIKVLYSRPFRSYVQTNLKLDVQGDLEFYPGSIEYKNLWIVSHGHALRLNRKAYVRAHVHGVLDLRNGRLDKLALQDTEVDRLVVNTDTFISESAFKRTTITKLVIECKDEEELARFKALDHPMIEALNAAIDETTFRTKTSYILAGSKIN